MRTLSIILSILVLGSIALSQSSQRVKYRYVGADTLQSNTPSSVLTLDDTLAISGYARINNVEAKSGDMVAIRDTTRPVLTLGVGSATRPIDSTVTVFLPGSATEYGGIHARGGLFSGGLSAVAGAFSSTLTLSGDVSQTYSGNTGFSQQVTSGAGGIGFDIDVFGESSAKGLQVESWSNSSGGAVSLVYGINARALDNGSGAITDQIAGRFSASAGGGNSVSNLIGLDVVAQSGAGVVTSNYGLRIGNISGGSSNYAINTGSGDVQLGTLTASRLVASDASKNLVSTITAGNLLSSVTGTTGTAGNLMFSISPTTTGTFDAEAGDFSSTLTLSGTAANIALGSNFISNGGTDAGLSFDASNNATLSGNLTVSGDVAVNGDDITSDGNITITAGGGNLHLGQASTTTIHAPSGVVVGQLRMNPNAALGSSAQFAIGNKTTAGANTNTWKVQALSGSWRDAITVDSIAQVSLNQNVLLSPADLTITPAGGDITLAANVAISGTGTQTIGGAASVTVFGGRARLKGYTVATLPAGTQGDTAFVTDALAPTFLTAIVGGGAVVTPVFYDGTNWVSY